MRLCKYKSSECRFSKGDKRCLDDHPIFSDKYCVHFWQKCCAFREKCKKPHVAWEAVKLVLTDKDYLDIFKGIDVRESKFSPESPQSLEA